MREAFVVVDLGYGDQGKGTITDFLVRDAGAHAVVRYNGGAQAGHNVVTPDGRHHTFAQFGAGSFVPGVLTVLSQHVAIQPWAMVVEAEVLARAGVGDAFERTLIAARAPVITPFHRAVNRLRERARGAAAHGTCGMGVGETVHDARSLPAEEQVVARDLEGGEELRARLARIQARKRGEIADVAAGDPELRVLEDEAVIDRCLETLGEFRRRARIVDDDEVGAMLRRDGAVVFEGAQGVLLDEAVGFHPHTTWSRCTAENADALLRAHRWDGAVHRIGVVRAYATRHGRGPFVTEDAELTARLPEPHNDAQGHQGPFRAGWFDAVTARYAVRACGGIDALAVTCVDRLRDVGRLRIATRYQELADLEAPPADDLEARARFTATLFDARPVYDELSTVEALLSAIAREVAPPALLSTGPGATQKEWLRRPGRDHAEST